MDGKSQKFVLSDKELHTLSAGLHNVRNGITHLTLFYDPTEKISLVIDLKQIRMVEADDRDLDERDLDIIGYKKFRLWQEPGFLRKLWLSLKWWLNKKKEVANA